MQLFKDQNKIKEYLDDLLSQRESEDLEFKQATGGFPGSFWDTYSAFANTDGGSLLIGVKDNGKIAGAKYSGSKELIKAEKILSDTTKNASILVTHTRQLADRIDAESEQVQRERLKGVYSGNILSLTELRRVLFEAVDILTTRLDRRKYLTQRYLMAFSEKAKYPAENTEKLTNDYFDAEIE